MGVSTSGFYDWFDRPISQREKDNQRLLTKIRCFHKSSHSIYGSPKIQKDLTEDGEQVSRQRVARLMKAANIQSKIVKKFVITTNSRNTKAPSPDRLKRNFKA
ncbi:IS3 family transposase, partial [Marinicella marina]